MQYLTSLRHISRLSGSESLIDLQFSEPSSVLGEINFYQYVRCPNTVRSMFKLLSGGSSSGAIVRVKWLLRTAGFPNASVEVRALNQIHDDDVSFTYACHVQTIIQKASQHFGLGATVQPELVLLATIEGDELEVTNDILGILPKGTTLTLSRIRRDNGALPTEARGTGKTKEVAVAEHVCSDDPPQYEPPSMIPPSHVATPIGMFVWVLT